MGAGRQIDLDRLIVDAEQPKEQTRAVGMAGQSAVIELHCQPPGLMKVAADPARLVASRRPEEMGPILRAGTVIIIPPDSSTLT